MAYQNIKEKRDAIRQAVEMYVRSGLNKTAAVRRVKEEFGYLTEIPVWNALKEENDGK